MNKKRETKNYNEAHVVKMGDLELLLRANGYEVRHTVPDYATMSKKEKLDLLLELAVLNSKQLCDIQEAVRESSKPVTMTLNFPKGFSEDEPDEVPNPRCGDYGAEPDNIDIPADSCFWDAEDVKEALAKLDDDDVSDWTSTLREDILTSSDVEDGSAAIMGFLVYGKPLQYRKFVAAKKAAGISYYLFCCNGEIFIRVSALTVLLRDPSVSFIDYVRTNFKDITGFDVDSSIIDKRSLTKYANIDCYDVKGMSGVMYGDWNDDTLISEGKLDGNPDSHSSEPIIVEEETVEKPNKTD